MRVLDLNKKKLLNCPGWLTDNMMYETLMGSVCYGTNTDASDEDVYGFCIPPKNLVFPHLGGEIPGFGRQIQRFEQYQQHHIKDVGAEKEYDIQIFSVVKYFQLLMENNPNIIDSIFTPRNCVTHCNSIGNIVRDNRKKFLHKGCYHKFKGYAYSQLHKMDSTERTGKRKETFDKYGWDLKFGMHLVRLLLECEQILQTGDLDLQRDKEYLKSIRRGEVSREQVVEFFKAKEKYLEELYEKSTLPYSPPEDSLRDLLLQCLEAHYGNLTNCVVSMTEQKLLNDLQNIKDIVGKY